MTWYRVHFRKGCTVVDGDAELARVQARLVPKVVHVEKAEVHKCSGCGFRGAWWGASDRERFFGANSNGRGWKWVGYYEDPPENADHDERMRTYHQRRVILGKYCPDCTPERPEGRPDVHQHRYEPLRREKSEWSKVWDARQAANPRIFPKPVWPKDRSGNGWCRWCGKAVTVKGRRTWHEACLTQFFLHTDLGQQYRHLVERDGERCGMCGRDGGRWVKSSKWAEDPIEDAWGLFSFIRYQAELEVDHVIELWEVANLSDDDRRPYFGPDNLWLLCKPCHKRKSADAAARRAKSRLLASAAPIPTIS